LTNNPAGVNTNLYSGTFSDTSDANGATLYYKYASTAAVGRMTVAAASNVHLAVNRRSQPGAAGLLYNNVAPTGLRL